LQTAKSGKKRDRSRVALGPRADQGLRPQKRVNEGSSKKSKDTLRTCTKWPKNLQDRQVGEGGEDQSENGRLSSGIIVQKKVSKTHRIKGNGAKYHKSQLRTFEGKVSVRGSSPLKSASGLETGA